MTRYILTDDQIKTLARELIDCIVLIMNTENPEKKPIGEMFDSKVLEQIFYNATSNEIPEWATHFAEIGNDSKAYGQFKRWEHIPG